MGFQAAKTTLAVAVLACVTCLACGGEESSRAELGKRQYLEYCASCHGTIPKGVGPVASALRQTPPDLSRLGEKYGLPLPHEQLARYIDGREELGAHGTREMPVWGRRLYESYPQTEGTERVKAGTVELILDYLDSVQVR